jgi:hypothetical protein
MPESTTANRAPRLKIVAWLMILLGLIYVGTVPYLLYLTTTPEITQDKDAMEAIDGMRIGALSCAVIAVPTLLAGVKLLQRRKWAYWLVIANLALTVAALAFGTFADFSSIEWDALWVLLVFFAVFIFALLSSTRRELNLRSSAPSA